MTPQPESACMRGVPSRQEAAASRWALRGLRCSNACNGWIAAVPGSTFAAKFKNSRSKTSLLIRWHFFVAKIRCRFGYSSRAATRSVALIRC